MDPTEKELRRESFNLKCKLMLLLMMTALLDMAGRTRFHYYLHTSQERTPCMFLRLYTNMSLVCTRRMASPSNLVLSIDQHRKVCILSRPLICNDLEDNQVAYKSFDLYMQCILEGKVCILIDLQSKR